MSPRKRAREIRLAQYAVLVVVLVALAFAADWGQVVSAFLRPDLVQSTLGSGIPQAFVNTIIYTAGAFVFGLVVGTVLALMRLSQVAPYRWLATAYIEFFRGLPAIIVLMSFGLVTLAFPDIYIPGDTMGTVWLGLGIVASAYMAETIRAGIQSVPKGQVEAARSLGMTSGAAMLKIVLPQAFRTVLPPLTNEVILLVKDSSLVYVLGLAAEQYELTKFGQNLAQSSANLTPLVVCGFAYLLITLPLTFLVQRMESRARKAR